MQSEFLTLSLNWATSPEMLFPAGIFLLAAIVLLLLALEAGTYPEVQQGFRKLGKGVRKLGKGFRKLGKALRRLRNSYHARDDFPARGQIAGR